MKKNEKDYLNGGLTPLMVAVKHKHVEAVRKMVKLKVKVQISTYTFQDCHDLVIWDGYIFNDQDVDLDPLDSDGHSLEFLVKRVDR